MKSLLGLNFAYGSNLDSTQLLSRCPCAQLEGPVILQGYRLEFFGAADLEVDSSGAVSAVAWRLRPDDEESLDLREGIGRPNLADSYVKRRVMAARRDGAEIAGYIYMMTPWRRARDPREPRPDYYARLAVGYREFGFDDSALTAALVRARGKA